MSPIARNSALFSIVLLATLVGLAPAGATTRVGNTTVIVRTVTGTLEQKVRTLVVRDDVLQNERIETALDGASQIVFDDGTKLTLGPHARITLDKFVYDPDPSRGAFFLTLTEGVLRFITGSLAHKAYSITTPNGTIGVRGTDIYIAVRCENGLCSTSLGSFSGGATITGAEGTRAVEAGEFVTVGAGSAGGTVPGSDLRAAVLTQVTDMLALVGFAGGIANPATSLGAATPVGQITPVFVFRDPQSVSPTTP